MIHSPKAIVPEPKTPLAATLGVDNEVVKAIGRIFQEATATFGINGSAVFDRLASGQTVAQALSVPPAVIDVMYARAHSWFALGRMDRAQTLFRALCLLDEQNADYWVGYGVCLRLGQRLDNAAKAFDIAAALRPDWAIPHFHAFELALSQGLFDEAQKSLLAYRERVTPDIPPPVVQEIQRLQAALELHQASAPVRSDSPPGM